MSLVKALEIVGRLPWIRAAARWCANRFPEGSRVTIRTGLARGCRWRRSHRYVNGYWIGHYEIGVQRAISAELAAGGVFYDVGANAGFFSLIAARRVGATGRVLSFDPDPFNGASCREQARINALSSWEHHEVAVADRAGRVRFSIGRSGSSTGRIDDEGSMSVESTSLDLVARCSPLPSLIKVDVEGHELAVLRGSRGLLEEVRPTWLIEIHGTRDEVEAFLTRNDYRVELLSGDSWERPGPHHVIARPIPRTTRTA